MASVRCIAVLLLLSVLTSSCVRSGPWRIAESGQCNFFDDDLHENKDADLLFIEFTERGNLFDRPCAEKVYERIEETRASRDVAVVVFVHGWKHNAGPRDENVTDFQRALATTLRKPFQTGYEEGAPSRKIIGVYLGWRGAVTGVPYLENVTYWDRKAVAQTVGKGGVTEVLLTLERIVECGQRDLYVECDLAAKDRHKNIYIVIGHSFGGAIVLSAMSEILLQRLLAARPAHSCGDKRDCIETDPLGNGVLILNPAIEANEAIQVKELINGYDFSARQDIMMHVISSSGDTATHKAFPTGQKLGTLFKKQKKLRRVYRSDSDTTTETKISEHQLDTTTIGNFAPFWTGLLYRIKANEDWQYVPLTDGRHESAGVDEAIEEHGPFAELRNGHIYAPRNSPVQVIYTDRDFISDHNDIFNPQVIAYAASIVNESLAVAQEKPVPAACMRNGEFHFGDCFAYYYRITRQP